MRYLKTLSLLILTVFLFGNLAGAVESIDIAANSAILVDASSGQLLYSKNDRDKAYPASITKLMTALLVAEQGDLNKEVTVSESALLDLSAAGSTLNIKAGEKMTVDNLLICLLVASANEAANILAENVAGSVDAFVEKMNKRAQELGCVNTHFANPHGLHEDDHYSCAYDIYLIAKEAVKHKRIAEIVEMQKATVPKTNLSEERFFFSTNSLLSPYKERTYLYKYTTGIKTGHTTQAGLCLAASATKNDTSLISVVMGAKSGPNKEKNQFVETKRLFEWGFKNFKTETVIKSAKPIGEVSVKLAWDRDHVIAAPKEELKSLVPTDFSEEKLEIQTDLPKMISAPVEKGAHLGTAKVIYNGSELGSVELIAADSVERSQLLYIWDTIVNIFCSTITKIILMALVVLAIFYIIFTISYNRRRSNSRRYRGRRR